MFHFDSALKIQYSHTHEMNFSFPLFGGLYRQYLMPSGCISRAPRMTWCKQLILSHSVLSHSEVQCFPEVCLWFPYIPHTGRILRQQMFHLYFHIISFSIFNTMLWTVYFVYGFSCYETLQFLLFLLGREQTQILWKRVSNIHVRQWFIQTDWLIIGTEQVASVCSGPFFSPLCFTAVYLAHHQTIIAVSSLLSA